MKKFVNWFFHAHITLLGIIPNAGKYQKFEKYFFISLVVCDLIILIAFIIAYTRAKTYVDYTWMLVGFSILITCFFVRLVGHNRRTRLLSIVARFRFDSSYFPTNEVQTKTNSIFEENFGRVFNILFSASLIFVVIPYVHCFFASDEDYNNPDLYLQPNLFHFWNVRSLLGCMLLTLIQSIAIGSWWFQCISLLIFLINVLCNIKAHMKELNEQFNYLLHSNEISVATKNNGKSFRWIYVSVKGSDHQYILLGNQLMAVIKYQNFLQKYVADFTDYVNFIISMNVIMCIFMCCFSILGIYEALGLQLPRSVFAVCIGICGLYLWSSIGQQINDLNDHLQEMLYHTQWYMLPVEFRKLLVISMILTHKEVKLTLFGIYKIDLEFCAKVMKVMYSFVNFMFLKRKK